MLQDICIGCNPLSYAWPSNACIIASIASYIGLEDFWHMQNNGESEPSEMPAKPVIKKKRLIWDIQIDPDDADMAGASEEAIKMMTQSRRVSDANTILRTCLL